MGPPISRVQQTPVTHLFSAICIGVTTNIENWYRGLPCSLMITIFWLFTHELQPKMQKAMIFVAGFQRMKHEQ